MRCMFGAKMNIFILTEGKWEPSIVSVHFSYEEAVVGADKNLRSIQVMNQCK